MAEHRSLTGASLHEPKGVETASNGQVYTANGSGSGAWTDRLSGINNLNSFTISGRVPDVSTSGSGFYHVVGQPGTLNKIYAALDGAITDADAVVTVYKNGVAQTPTLTIAFTGSGAGVVSSAVISPAIAFAEGDVVHVATAGGSTGTQGLGVTLRFSATT